MTFLNAFFSLPTKAMNMAGYNYKRVIILGADNQDNGSNGKERLHVVDSQDTNTFTPVWLSLSTVCMAIIMYYVHLQCPTNVRIMTVVSSQIKEKGKYKELVIFQSKGIVGGGSLSNLI